MAKKAAKKSPKRPAKKRVKAPEIQTFEQAQPLALSSGSSPLQKLAEVGSMVVGLAFVVFLATNLKCNRSGSASGGTSAPAASSAAAKRDWGPSVKLDLVSKFKIPVESTVWSIKADASGAVYILTASGIDRYSGGKKDKSIALTLPDLRMNMDFDGEAFYVVSGVTIQKVAKDLSQVVKKFQVNNAADLIGIAVSPKNRIYVSDYTQHQIYVVDTAGVAKGFLGTSAPTEGGILAVVDIALDSASGVYTHDHLAARINHFDAAGKVVATWAAPWNKVSQERLCVLGNKVYVSGYNDQRIFIQDLSGVNVGNCAQLSDGTKMDQPVGMGAGKDGHLYILQEGTVYKLKVTAGSLPVAAPAPQTSAVKATLKPAEKPAARPAAAEKSSKAAEPVTAPLAAPAPAPAAVAPVAPVMPAVEAPTAPVPAAAAPLAPAIEPAAVATAISEPVK